MLQEKESLSDFQLLQGCKSGDKHAWSQLLDKYERLVYSIPLNYGLGADDAADIVQIVFSSFLQRLDTLRADSHLGGWLSTVARRHTWRVLQRAKREISDALDTESTHALLPAHQDHIRRWEMTEWLHSGLQKIDARCRNLLYALYFDSSEPSYGEIAQKLKITEGSIGPTRARCLAKLKEMLSG